MTDSTSLLTAAWVVVDLAQPDEPAEGVPGYWVPSDALKMLRAELEEAATLPDGDDDG